MTAFDHRKYQAYRSLVKTDRKWPNAVLDEAPLWCSVDLRDGNQALVDPMSPEQKLKLFQLLVELGFREIEVGFPAASKPDFDFVRKLIEEGHIPENVRIQVLTQAREELIAKTFEALAGVPKAIIHLYNSTSKVQRDKVFRKPKEQIKAIAVQGAKWVKKYATNYPKTQWQFQYSPESFTGTELDFAVEVCDAVNLVWQPTQANPVIINLPSTVEMITPNVFADQIEWMCEHLANREALVISLHTHNDRGTGIAAAELGLLAGADRIEGTLLGNGERTGNMDIVTVAMNLYSQGVDPKLNFADMDRVIQTVESCTQIPVHPRHPYAGELVFSAFSGSHQDAINKCLTDYRLGETWDIAYLPIDPKDVGRSYQQVIRVNSQSGKAGAAYVLKQQAGYDLPRWMQVDFSTHVQKEAENKATELSSQSITQLFEQTYLAVKGAYSVQSFNMSSYEKTGKLQVVLSHNNKEIAIAAQGKGPMEAFINALENHFACSLTIIDYNEHTLGSSEQSEAISYIKIRLNNAFYCGVGRSADILRASFQAILNAISRQQTNSTIEQDASNRAAND